MSAHAGARSPTGPRLLAPDGTVPEGYEPSLEDDELLDALPAHAALAGRRRARASRSSARAPGHLLARHAGRRPRSSDRRWRSTRRATGSSPSTASCPRCCVRATRWCTSSSTSWATPWATEMPGGRERPARSRSRSPRRSRTRSGWRGACATRAATPSCSSTSATARPPEGDFHEACNLAGVRRAPVIFFLQNNGWAISTPLPSRPRRPASRCARRGYGFPGELVDGNDLLAVHEATARAVERARGRARARR